MTKNNQLKYKLIKFLTDDLKVRYQFLDSETGEPISQEFRSEEESLEWRLEYLASLYDGDERRSSQIDRRKVGSTRTFHHRIYGRRESDRELPVEDRASSMIKNIKKKFRT